MSDRQERIRNLKTQPSNYYDACILKALSLGEEYPDYRIQIDVNVKGIILEYCKADPSYCPQSVIDRFEEMEDGFGVRCFQAEGEELHRRALESPDEVIILDSRFAEYERARGKAIMAAKVAASQGKPISAEAAEMIRKAEEICGDDLLEYYRKNHPKAYARCMAEYGDPNFQEVQ